MRTCRRFISQIKVVQIEKLKMKAFTKSVVLVHTFIMKVVQEEQVLAYVAIAPSLSVLP